jgi:predicted anti-sigma-YlaC factor YlaD
VWDGPLKLQPEEVLEARFIGVDQVMRKPQKPYCPDSLAALKRYLGRRRKSPINWRRLALSNLRFLPLHCATFSTCDTTALRSAQ